MHVKRFHWIIDITKCNDSINNPQILRNFIEELTQTIGMHILEGPIMARGIESNPGLSMVAIIDFSHISIHTFENSKEILVDIFSCKPYDKYIAIGLCKSFFATEASESREKEVWWG